ncbi:MAG: hypothetical protein M3437_15085 [Chloroflexota bacterium]|nr:hypothetical protein [Chloroflexota bacterium]MDQ5865327.1 hypothetical protein [Chloroflexota bacterium]
MDITENLDKEHRGLHVAIQTLPSMYGYDTDVRLIKSAILYADKITLYSFQSWIALTLFRRTRHAASTTESIEDFINWFKNHLLEADASFDLQGFHRNFTDLIHISDEGLLEIHAVPKMLDYLSDFYERAHGKNLNWNQLLQLGEETMNEKGYDYSVLAGQVGSFFQLVIEGSTYPLFEDYLVGLAHKIITMAAAEEPRLQQIIQTGTGRAKHIQLAAELFSRLPGFHDAPIDELIDIRRELERPLVRFRGALLDFSDQIRFAPRDKDFTYEVGKIIQRNIEPAILDIEDSINSNVYLERLSKKLLKEPLQVAGGSALGMVLGTLSSLPVVAVPILAAGVAGAILALDSYNEWKEKTQEIERNQIYFYYRTRERLSKVSQSRLKRGRSTWHLKHSRRKR